MQREILTKKIDIRVTTIIQLWGDLGYKAEGFADGHFFTAGLGYCPEWAKNGWNTGRLKGLQHGEEYTVLSNIIRAFLNENYYPIKSEMIKEVWTTSTGQWQDCKKEVLK